MPIPSRRTIMVAGVAVGALVASSAALAQPAPSTPGPASTDASSTVGEVIVTAQKREERLKDVPLAITALSSETLQRTGALSLRDITSLAPSLYFSQSQSPTQSNISIRGIGSNGGVAGLQPDVGIYVDGVYLDRTVLGVTDFDDIDRIEVLRGAQGTLFGKNTPAGSVSFITKRPSFTPHADVSATVGNYGAHYFNADATGPITDQLALRVSGFYRERDGYIHNVFNGQDENGGHAYGLRARALWTPTKDIDVLLTYQNHRENQQCCAAILYPLAPTQAAVAAGIGKPITPSNSPDQLITDTDGSNAYKHVINGYTAEVNYRPGGFTVTSISSAYVYDQRSHIDADFAPYNFLSYLAGNRDYSQISQELRLTSPTDKRLIYVTGLYFFRKVVFEDGPGIIGPDTGTIFKLLGGTLARLAPLYTVARSDDSGSHIDDRSYAAFGQGTYKLTDHWDATLGLRYTYDHKSIYSFATTTEPVPVINPPRSVSARKGDGSPSGVVNVRYRPDRDTTWYASVTRGYKAFGFNDSSVNTALGQQRFFNSEFSTGGELGLKKTARPLNLTFATDVFYTVFDNYQASSFAPGNVFLLQNAGGLTTRGFEFEGTWTPKPGLVLTGAYTYLDAHYDDFKNGPGLPSGAPTQDLSGKVLQDAPKHSVSGTAQYTWQLAPGLGAFVRGEASYRSKVQTDQALNPLLVQKGYGLFNARLGLTHGPYTLELWGRNLSDEIVLYRGGTPPAIFTTGSLIRFVGEPRTYGLTVRANF